MVRRYRLPECVFEARDRLRLKMCTKVKRNPLKEREVNLIVAMRYGSITDFSKVYQTFTEIGRRLTVLPQTLSTAVKRWHENGNKFMIRKKYKARPRKLLPEVEAEVCSNEMLIKHQFLSIKERVVRIFEEFGV